MQAVNPDLGYIQASVRQSRNLFWHPLQGTWYTASWALSLFLPCHGVLKFPPCRLEVYESIIFKEQTCGRRPVVNPPKAGSTACAVRVKCGMQKVPYG